MIGAIKKTTLLGVSLIGNMLFFYMLAEMKGLPGGAAVCLYVAGWIWILANLAYTIFICATWGEESVRGFVRSWRIERELKKQEAAPPESLDASDGETAEVTPSPAYVLPQQNWKTICDQVHNCGGELLPNMEKELWGKEFLREAIREYLSRKYQAKIEDLKIRFIVQNKKPGLKVSYTRNKIVEREKTFIPEEAIGKDPDAELIILLIQVAVDEWHRIKDALEEPSNFARCFQAFPHENKVWTTDEVQQIQRENTELRKENKELREGIEKLEKSLRKTEAERDRAWESIRWATDKMKSLHQDLQ